MNEPKLVTLSPTVTENDRKALVVARKQEHEKIKDGWRYYKINERLQILVPFGKNGKPTKEGKRMIEVQKRAYGIK